MRFLDPRPEVARPVDGPGAPRWGGTTDAVVFGLLANGFPDSAAFLAGVATEITRRYPTATFHAVTKTTPPEPLGDDRLRLLTEECDVVVAAYGH